jgi:hypothetical protein
MKTLGTSGRGSRWYGDETAVLRGRTTSEAEPLPVHVRDDSPFVPGDPLRQKRKARRRRWRGRLRDPLTGRKSQRQREREWEIANGLWIEDENSSA